jgi:hypothetical protein
MINTHLIPIKTEAVGKIITSNAWKMFLSNVIVLGGGVRGV